MGDVKENNPRESMPSQDQLPDFVRPPVSEVALSLQFEALAKLRSPVTGLLWSQFKNEYPLSEEHPPIESSIEKFGGAQFGIPKLQFEILNAPPPTRVWFLNDAGTELIQVQQDRFIHNWRRRKEDDQYPRYSALRSKLIHELRVFQGFIERENLGELVFNQVEVTFVNTILSGEGWERHGQLQTVLTTHSGAYSDDFFQEPEWVQTALRYVIPGDDGLPIGRLHITVLPAVSRKDKRPAFNLTIIARCNLSGGNSEEAIRSLDLAHKWVVKGFASITTKEMHAIWGRQL
jgi:uncharacterized protein (TIGR04255 family)